jgi:hypothetical protein
MIASVAGDELLKAEKHHLDLPARRLAASKRLAVLVSSPE